MGPPYPPQTQGLGSPPTPIPDVPVAAVFLALYLVTGPPHLALFVRNKKAGHKFPFSMAMFGQLDVLSYRSLRSSLTVYSFLLHSSRNKRPANWVVISLAQCQARDCGTSLRIGGRCHTLRD